MSRIKRNSQSGFSLIELMVVVSIMAILAVIGLGGFSNAQKKARDSRRKADIKTIQNAMISSSDTGGNFDARAAESELSGSFPIDPRKQNGKPTYYFLYAPSIDTGEEDFNPTSVYYLNNVDNNSGIACAVLEAADTGNAQDARTDAAVDGKQGVPFTSAGIAQGIDSVNEIVSIDTEKFDSMGSIVLTECKIGVDGNCNFFCATF